MDIIVAEDEDSNEDYKSFKLKKIKKLIYLPLKTVKTNMQKALAMQIQEITQELRLQQKNLLDNLNKFQKTNKHAYDFSLEDNYAKNTTNNLNSYGNQVSYEKYIFYKKNFI